MILHRYLDALGDKVHDRLIDAAMPVFELHHFGASSLAEHLMPEADAEERHFSEQLFYLGERAFHLVGVSRAIAQEHAVWLEREHLFSRRIPWHDRNGTTRFNKPIKDRTLHAAIVGDHVVACFDRARLREGMNISIGIWLYGIPRNLFDEVHLRERGCSACFGNQAYFVEVFRGKHRPHCTCFAQMTHERACIDPFDGYHAALAQELRQRFGAAPIGRMGAHIAHHQPAQGDLARLHIIFVHAVVADLRIGHGHDLAGVRRIGDHFQIAHQPRVEAELAAHFTRSSTGKTSIATAVF